MILDSIGTDNSSNIFGRSNSKLRHENSLEKFKFTQNLSGVIGKNFFSLERTQQFEQSRNSLQ